MPTCVSCNKVIMPKERFVKFFCPSCGAVTLWRCQKCRKFVRNYACPKCGFQGP
ncbi:MAG: zinc finger domain-containing protein [Thermoproteota archaeon]